MSFDLPKNEEKILKFWKEKKIFKKSLEKTKKGKRFVFYEGPPFANGLPGIHHLLARAFKDIILRYKTMQGFYVERRAGWDTHGLPTEMEAEKKLKIKSKKEIEKLGIEKFIDECRRNVFTYKKEWEEFTERIGFWLDFETAYITCDNNYIESLWWILKQIWDKGLLYQDYKVVPYCPRCGTSLSSHEVAQGYKTIKEDSIYVKFPVKGQKNTYFLVWTTTPWTLPANVAVAVGKNIDYVMVKAKKVAGKILKEPGEKTAENILSDDSYIFSKEYLERKYSNFKALWKIIEKFKGEDLLDWEYTSIFDFNKPDNHAYPVISGDFVTTEEGTGIVHIAPAFGEDDMRVGKENNLPVLMTVDEEGKFKKEIKDWAGMLVTDEKTNILIKKDLKDRNLLYDEQIYEHDYPFCWRCKEKLIYYAKNSWFIKMSAVKKELMKNSEEINWAPKHIKKGRFGEWLKGVKDWNLSRERYWGTPLPIWRCQIGETQKGTSSSQARAKLKTQNYCNNIKIIGSVDELEKLSGKKIKDLHRPFIDRITFKCEKCEGTMKRVPEVVDCWFDSGSMSFAQWHYPFENKDKIDKGGSFPADFIAEGIDQTRGWFYTLLAISTLLGKGISYKNVICLGLVLDEKGQKMSKSRGNIIEPQEIINKFGADCARFYFYTVNQAGEVKRFDFKDAQSLYRKFFDTLWQSYTFFETYVSKKEFPISLDARRRTPRRAAFQFPNSKNILDKWIISRLENLNSQVSKNLDSYDVVLAARALLDFVDDLSNWYIRRSRRRFQKPKTKEIKEEASQTLYYVLLKLTKLIAPFTPFIAEELYQKLNGAEKSVHLDDYPTPDEKLINAELEEKMEKIRGIITEALAQRAEAGIKVRQPLAELRINDKELKNEKELLDLIKEEVNVKKVVFDDKIKKEMELDTKITEELKKEGIVRDFIRNVQKMKKTAGFLPEDRVLIYYFAEGKVKDIIENKKDFILKETASQNIELKKEAAREPFYLEIKVGDEKAYLKVSKGFHQNK